MSESSFNTVKAVSLKSRLLIKLKKLHQRLLPDDPSIGWSPYLWLLYLGFLAPGFLKSPIFSLHWSLTMVSIRIFLWLYFRGFWHRGTKQLWNIAAVTLLGMALLPFNVGATVYFIYAGAPSAAISTPITALITLTVIAAILVIESLLIGIPLTAWLIPCFILMLVGISNIFYCEMARKNARLRLSQEEVTKLAAVAERERIARDLHDLLGQSLSLITIKAELASRLFERNPERAQREIQEVERVSREALREVRKAVTGYRHTGWDGELEKSCLALKAAGLEVKVNGKVQSIPSAQESVLCMVLREAITNIIRHAHARHCEIQLSCDQDFLLLDIHDDGKGGKIIPGNGLMGMRERVEQLNGTLAIENTNGTTLQIQLPLLKNVSPIQPSWNTAA